MKGGEKNANMPGFERAMQEIKQYSDKRK